MLASRSLDEKHSHAWARPHARAERLREHGNFIIGDVFVVPRGPTVELGRLEDARRRVEAIDRRLRAIDVVPSPTHEPNA